MGAGHIWRIAVVLVMSIPLPFLDHTLPCVDACLEQVPAALAHGKLRRWCFV